MQNKIAKNIEHLFESALQQKVGSGMVGAFGKLDSPLAATIVAAGKTSHSALGIPVTEHSTFDLASLTKILFTASVFMKWADQGKIDLSEHHFGASIKELLSHTSGYPAWTPIYESMRTMWGDGLYALPIPQRDAFFVQEFLKISKTAQPGGKAVYSDVNMWLLGLILEKKYSSISPLPLLDIFNSEVLSELPGANLHFRPVVQPAYVAQKQSLQVVATEVCPWRGELQGQVHDDNTWARGGVSTHAGLFGSVRDVLAWVDALMAGRFGSGSTLRQFFDEHVSESGNRSGRGLGFDRVSADGTGTTGSAFSENSVGHLGFTGTSLWMDLDSGDFAVLLTNRVHPSRQDLRIKQVRQAFHTLVRS